MKAGEIWRPKPHCDNTYDVAIDWLRERHDMDMIGFTDIDYEGKQIIRLKSHISERKLFTSLMYKIGEADVE